METRNSPTSYGNARMNLSAAPTEGSAAPTEGSATPMEGSAVGYYFVYNHVDKLFAGKLAFQLHEWKTRPHG